MAFTREAWSQKSDSETFSSSRAGLKVCGRKKGSEEVRVAAATVKNDSEFELLKCKNMRFFTELIRSKRSFFEANFFLLPLLMLWLPPKRKASKIWASRSFAPHKHAHTMERNFHLFYSLTKLTSTYFCFFSNIIKAVKRAKVSEEQFVTVLPSCVYLRPTMYVVQFRKYRRRLRKHVC